MNRVKLYLEKDGKEEEILFEVRRMINAGYTGRDQESIRRHIEELKKEGIPAADSTPAAYDEIILRSWARNDRGEKVLYQHAPMSAILAPEELMAFIKNKLDDGNLEGVVIFSGTVAILPQKINFGDYFEVELSNPRMERKLSCAYNVQILDYLRG